MMRIIIDEDDDINTIQIKECSLWIKIVVRMKCSECRRINLYLSLLNLEINPRFIYFKNKNMSLLISLYIKDSDMHYWILWMI